MVENSELFNRLRSGNLEKAAVTGVCRSSRSPLTVKISSKVHIRLRSQNLEKPRIAGLCGRKVVACDHLPQSVKEHSVKLSRNGIIYATVEKTSKKAEKVRAIPVPCC